MTLEERWEEVRAACEVLHCLAVHQAENDQHPCANQAAQWLDHWGAVAAAQSGASLRATSEAAAMPVGGYLQ